MDIIIRAGKDIADFAHLAKLGTGELTPFARGREPLKIAKGDRVYFYKDQRCVAYCHYSYYGPFNIEKNVQHDPMKGDGAIYVEGPLVTLPGPRPSALLRGSWRWRYVKVDVRRALGL